MVLLVRGYETFSPERISEPWITPAGKAQADSKAEQP
jgi:hypothetical protein